MAEEKTPSFLGQPKEVTDRKYNNLLSDLTSQTVGGRSFSEIYKAIEDAEVGGDKNAAGWPYIFTKSSDKSSAFGPAQILYSTVLDYFYDGADETEQRKNMKAGNFKEGYTQLPVEVKSYIKKFIEQGIKKRNRKGGVYGNLGVGDISRADHEKYYPFLFGVHVQEKKKIADEDTVKSFVNAHYGSTTGSTEEETEARKFSLDRLQKKVQKYLDDTGIEKTPESIADDFEPTTPDTSVVEPGTTDMLEDVEQEQLQQDVDAADRDEQLQQAESLKVQTAKAIPTKPEPEKEQSSLFENVMQGVQKFFKGDDEPVRYNKQDLTDLIKNYAQGGMTMRTPSMPQQMSMFDEGGLLDEGGSIDPVSGNDVPLGSLQEEVRDDIPAQLSEGEFVFPADVVRYWGLETLMKMRQEAKAGLKRMEAMGQMGNSDEAVLPDDIPFDINDLELGEEPLQFQEGGMVTSGIEMAQYNPFQPYIPAQPYYAERPVYQGEYQAPEVPTFEAPDVMPEFKDLIPASEGYDELVEYYNPETGEVRMIPFVDGEPIYPIPTGFIKREETEVEAPEVDPVVAPSVEDTVEGDDESVPRFGYSITTGERVRVGNLTPQEILEGVQDKKDRFSITGSRGMGIPIPGIGTIATLLGADLPKFGDKEPANIADAPPGYQREINTRRKEFENVLGVEITGYVGFQKGDLSVNTGGVFDSRGRAVNEDGSAATTTNGTRAYASFKDWTNDMAAGRESGWRGGPINEKTYNQLSETGKARYDKYADITGAKSHKPEPEPVITPTTTKPKPKSDPSPDTTKDAAPPPPPLGDPYDDDDDAPTGGTSYGVGTISGGSSACFAKGSRFKMSDGTIKKIEDIDIGETVFAGGKVSRVIKGDGTSEDWYMYGDTKVTGSHAVFENNQWKRVQDSDNAIPSSREDFLYTLVCEQHKLISEDDVMYSDYDEVDNDNIHDELLDIMNERDIVSIAA